jgi:hypothetical protein
MNGRTQSVTTFTSLGALHAYLNQLHDDDGRWQMTETPMTTTRAIVEVVVTKEKTTTEGVERGSVARDWSLQIFQ